MPGGPIANKINGEGVLVRRSTEMVRKKIKYLEDCMTKATEWTETETGAGLMDSGDIATWRESVLQKCKYYYELIDIFKDRARFVPKAIMDNAGLFPQAQVLANDTANVTAAGAVSAQENNAAASSSAQAQSNAASTSTASSKGGATTTPKRRKDRTPKRTGGKIDAMFEEYLVEKLETQRSKKRMRQDSAMDEVTKKVKLAKQFRQMVDALGGDRLRAAKVCSEFEIFLSDEEKVDLEML